MVYKIKKQILLLFFIQYLFIPAFIMSNNIPQLINYQGVITDTNGKTFHGQKTITFNIHDGSGTNASIVWGPQTFKNVNIVNGRFNVILGEVDENEPARKIIDAFGGEKRFIGIKVDGKEIFPRQQVLTTPFSINTQHANESDHAKQADHAGVADKSLHHSNVIPVGTISSHFGSEAPQGWLICDGSSIPDGSQYDQLRDVLGEAGKLPDLRNLFQKDSLMNIKGKFEYSDDLCVDGEVYSNIEFTSSVLVPYTVAYDTRIIKRGAAEYAFDDNNRTAAVGKFDAWIAYKFNEKKRINLISIEICDDFSDYYYYNTNLYDIIGQASSDFGIDSYNTKIDIQVSQYSTNGIDGTWYSVNNDRKSCTISPVKYPYNHCYIMDCSFENDKLYSLYKLTGNFQYDLVEIEMKEKLTTKDFSVNYIIKY